MLLPHVQLLKLLTYTHIFGGDPVLQGSWHWLSRAKHRQGLREKMKSLGIRWRFVAMLFVPDYIILSCSIIEVLSAGNISDDKSGYMKQSSVLYLIH